MNTKNAKGRTSALTARRVGVLALAASATVATAGCSSSAAHHPASAPAPASTTAGSPTTSSPALGYVAQVDALCGELQGKVIAAYGGSGHHTSYPISVYRAEHQKLAAIYAAFDARVDAIPVKPAERAAAKAFDAYRQKSDAADRKLAAAAATGKQANFDAAFKELVSSEGKPDPVMDAMHGAGIFCNAR